jgi:predicted lipid-binding transport protein (Tim44 family)
MKTKIAIYSVLVCLSSFAFEAFAADPAPAPASKPAAAPTMAAGAPATPAATAPAPAPAGAPAAATAPAATAPAASADPAVKKATASSICHDKTSPSYKQTKNFTPFNSMEECLKSGGKPLKK